MSTSTGDQSPICPPSRRPQMNAIRKKYQYRCKCGLDPMKGGVRLSPGTDEQFRQFFDMLDLAWAESHNQPGCGLKDKTVVTVPPRDCNA